MPAATGGSTTLGQVSTDVDYELVAVDELLRRTAMRLPDKVALIDGL